MTPIRRPPPAPRRARARRPFRWLRRLLLVLGLVFVAGLVVLLAAYNFGQVEDVVDSDAATPAADDNTVRRGRQIDFEQTTGGETIFRVRADESIETADDVSHLLDVVVDLFGENDRMYTITSDKARIDQQASAASFEGNVVVSGWKSLRLLTRNLDLAGGGAQMISPGTVELHWTLPDGTALVGRASRMRIDRDEDFVALTGGVHIRSEPGAETPIRLDCERLTYRRSDNLLRATDDVDLRWGGQELRTHALTVFLREDGETLRLLRARWDVRGMLRQFDDAGAETTVAFGGQLLEVEPNEDNPEYRKTTLDGAGEEAVFLDLVQPDGAARRLEGAKLEARSLAERLVQVEGFGNPLQLVEYLAMDDRPWMLRRACSDRGTASFQPDGTIGQLFLEGQVELRDEQVTVSGGDRALIDTITNRLDIEGQPAALYAERGELIAPKIRYGRGSGILRAWEGVEATLPARSAAALGEAPFADGDGPVRVVSREAVWTQTPESFSFDGDVRAWRGTNLLLASQLRGDTGQDRMAASGDVKTVWLPEARNDVRPVERIEITAGLLTYDRGGGLLTYENDVLVEQGERRIRCDELRVTVSDGGSARRMACLGDVELDDPIEAQNVRGDQAIYEVAERRIEIAGEEVVLVDGAGNKLTGAFLDYDLESGRTRMRSRVPDDALVPPGGPVEAPAQGSAAPPETRSAPSDPVS
ncbi:MAG: LptA/OstA family protein [Acidobacteriota bacterium]